MAKYYGVYPYQPDSLAEAARVGDGKILNTPWPADPETAKNTFYNKNVIRT